MFVPGLHSNFKYFTPVFSHLHVWQPVGCVRGGIMEKYNLNIFVLSPILCITITLLLLLIIISLLPTLELQTTDKLAPIMINLKVI